MRLLIIGSADDIDVTMGLRMLLDKKPFTEILLPEAEPNETYDQIVMTASERGIPVRQGGQTDSLMNDLQDDDVVAIAWDDSEEAFEAVLHLGGGRTELWDIADGLSIIDVETEALEEHLSHVIEDFVDSLTAVVYKMVMDNINGDGKFKYRRPE
jgi:hypothetical protein